MKKLITTIFIISILFTLKSLVPNTVSACCNDNQCTPGYCVNAPSSNCGLPGVGEGVCVSGYETCSGSSSSSECPPGQECINRLCRIVGGGGGGGGGGAYTPPTCASGKALTAYSPMGTLDNNACRFQGTCGNLFPSIHNMTGCGGVVTKGNCSVSYMCCSPGQTVNCTGGTVTRVGNCNANTEVKLSAATYVIGIDEAGKPINEIRSVCKLSCSCVTPCTPSSPSAPVPTSPVNGITTANTTPALMWDRTAQVWGTG